MLDAIFIKKNKSLKMDWIDPNCTAINSDDVNEPFTALQFFSENKKLAP